MENDPKYDHWIDKEAKGMVSGRNIEEKNTNRGEASPRGRQDFLRGAKVKERDDQPCEAEAESEIQQLMDGKEEKGERNGEERE